MSRRAILRVVKTNYTPSAPWMVRVPQRLHRIEGARKKFFAKESIAKAYVERLAKRFGGLSGCFNNFFRLHEFWLSVCGKDAGLGHFFKIPLASSIVSGSSFESAARMRKDCNRSDHKDRGKDHTAVAINSYRPLLLLGVIEDDGRHNLDEGKENEQCAG